VARPDGHRDHGLPVSVFTDRHRRPGMGASSSLHRSTPSSPAMERESTMAKQQVDDDQSWWPRIKDWLGILLVIVALVLVGWIFVLEGIH
jgi:hypothetical protein